MHKVLLVRSSVGRKKEFKVTTTIEEDKKGKVVVKRASYPEGKPFVKNFLQKNKSLQSAMKNVKGLEVLDMHATDESVWTKYIPGATFDEEFSQALQQRNKTKINSLFGEVLNIIDQLESYDGVIDKKANTIFGDFGIDGKTELIKCGYIDFNLDNFIRGSSTVFLIDPEFKYDFGVPKQYVVNRLIVSYLVRYNHLTSSLANENFEIIKLCNNLCIPKSLWNEFKERFTGLPEAEATEEKFQRYYSYSAPLKLNIKKPTQWTTHTKPVFHDVIMQLNNLRTDSKDKEQQLNDCISKLNINEAKLQETEKSLRRYHSFFPIRLLRFIKRKLN